MAGKKDSSSAAPVALTDENSVALEVFRERVRLVQMDGQSEGSQLAREAQFAHRAARAFLGACKPAKAPAAPKAPTESKPPAA